MKKEYNNDALNKILTKRYPRSRNSRNYDFFEDSKKMLMTINVSDTKLTDCDIERYIKFFMEGKSFSFLNKYSSIEILELLTIKHLIPTTLVSKILQTKYISCRFSNKWLYNLMDNGYVFTESQQKLIFGNGYTPDFKIPNQLNSHNSEISIDNINSWLSSLLVSLDDITKILEIKGMKFNNESIKIIINKGYDLFKIGDQYFDMNKDFLQKIISVNDLSKISILKSFSYNTVMEALEMEQIKQRFQNYNQIKKTKPNENRMYQYQHEDTNYLLQNVIFWKNIEYIFVYYNIDKKERMLVLANFFEENFFDKDYNVYRYTKNIVDHVDAHAEYTELFIKNFIDACNDTENSFFIEEACRKNDKFAFDNLINNTKIILTNNCFSNACESGSLTIIQDLMELKVLPSKESLCYIKDPVTLFLLIENGLPVDFEVIEKLISFGTYIDLKKYGIEYNLDLYKLCRKYHNNVYEEQFKSNKSLHIPFRNKIKTGEIEMEEFLEEINKNGIIPDITMYNDFLENDDDDLVSLLEEKYNIKPNILSLISISDYNTRLNYLQKKLKF